MRKSEILLINGLCLAIILGALGVAVWAIATGQAAAQGVDGLFLVLVCLAAALTFSAVPFLAWRRGLLQAALRDLAPKRGEEKEPPLQAALSDARERQTES